MYSLAEEAELQNGKRLKLFRRLRPSSCAGGGSRFGGGEAIEGVLGEDGDRVVSRLLVMAVVALSPPDKA